MSVALALKDEAKEADVESEVKKPEGTTPSFKVSPLYEGDTTVDLTDPFYSESNINHLLGIIADINSGKAKMEEHDLIEV